MTGTPDDDPPAAGAQVTIWMTPRQEQAYAREYGLDPGEVARDVGRHLKARLPALLASDGRLSQFATVTISDL